MGRIPPRRGNIEFDHQRLSHGDKRELADEGYKIAADLATLDGRSRFIPGFAAR